MLHICYNNIIIDDYPVSQYAVWYYTVWYIASLGTCINYINHHLKHHVANVGLTVYYFSYNIILGQPRK